jgi:hypothetical protein
MAGHQVRPCRLNDASAAGLKDVVALANARGGLVLLGFLPR